MTKDEKIKWCIDQHVKTNHYFDQYLPYEFHLRMVNQVFKDFKHLLLPTNDETIEMVELGCWGHDLIEDCRLSYNDLKKVMGVEVADIVYAVTNEKGKDRDGKANEKYYREMRDVPYAVFVKLCDRIANVQYGKLTKSRMFDGYRNENPKFLRGLLGDMGGILGDGSILIHPYREMMEYLMDLFKETKETV